MRKFVVKIIMSSDGVEDFGYKVVSAHNEYSCRSACNNDRISFIFEVDPSIKHWDAYELGLFYGWVDSERGYLPINQREVINEYLGQEGEIRRRWLIKYAKIFEESMNNLHMFMQYNKCLELLKETPTIWKLQNEGQNGYDKMV